MIGYIDVDTAIKMGIKGNVEVYCNGCMVTHCVEASSDQGYVKFLPDPVTVTDGEIDLITIYGA